MWKDILKNIQISSQRTSSRDYVKPDEPENNCKERFLAVIKKLESLKIDGMRKAAGAVPGSFFFIEEGKKQEQDALIYNFDIGSYYQLDNEMVVPDEIYCRAIEEYEKTPEGDSVYEDYGNFIIHTRKAKIARTTSNYTESYNEFVYEVVVGKVGHRIDKFPSEVLGIHIRVRQYLKGNYGNDGSKNEELVNRLKDVIEGVLVF